jgi:capsule polysaccharide export protein KpsE/RkpR
MDDFKNNSNLLDLIAKWKYHLLIIVLVSVILSVVFSSPFFIKPKYKSFAVLYPANIYTFSKENESEQMLQLLQSRDIQDSIIKKFDLATHYGINPNYEHYYSTMIYLYSENISIRKTEFESIVIEVMDTDPKYSRNIINSIIEYYNRLVGKMQKEKATEAYRNGSFVLKQKEHHLDSLKNALTDLGTKYGLFNLETQSKELTRGLLRTSGTNINNAELLKLKTNLELKGGELQTLTDLISSESEGISNYKTEIFDKAMIEFYREYTFASIVTKPYISDKKAYPVRWLIVSISTIAALFFSFIIIGVFERLKQKPKSN